MDPGTSRTRRTGQHLSDPALVVTSLAAPGYDTYTWFDPSDAGTIHKALEDLRQYIISEGPFDALLSFSQGGCLGAMLILDESRRRLRPPPFSCAIFLSWSIWHPELSYLSEVFNSVSEEDKISIPTTHILGKNDTYVRGYEKTVRDFCRPETSSIYMHNSGHEVPRGFDLTQAIQHIRRTIDLVSADRVNGNV